MALWWNFSNSVVILDARKFLVYIGITFVFDYPDSCLMCFDKFY